VAPRHLSTQNFARYLEIPTTANPRSTTKSATTSAKPKIDVAEQIEKLGRLRDQGLLTDEEFQSKKEELLSRL
jgi:hypothetical protein